MSKILHLHLQHLTTHQLHTTIFEVLCDWLKVITFEAEIGESGSGWSLRQVFSWIKPLGFCPPRLVWFWGFLDEFFINLAADSVILKGRFRVRFVVVEISRAEGLKNWGLFNKGAGIGGLSTTIEGLDSPWIKEQGVEATFNVLRILLYICLSILV